MQAQNDIPVADRVRGHWADRIVPVGFRPYARMARLERPIGWWLLLWPCWWSSAMATDAAGAPPNLWHLVLFMIGADRHARRRLHVQRYRRPRPRCAGGAHAIQATAKRASDGAAGAGVPRVAGADRPGCASPVQPRDRPPRPPVARDGRDLSVHETVRRLAAAFSRDFVFLGGVDRVVGDLRRSRLAAGASLRGRHPVDYRLRHDLRPSGQGGRRADRRAFHRAAVRRPYRPLLALFYTGATVLFAVAFWAGGLGISPMSALRPAPAISPGRSMVIDIEDPDNVPDAVPRQPRLRLDRVRGAGREGAWRLAG